MDNQKKKDIQERKRWKRQDFSSKTANRERYKKLDKKLKKLTSSVARRCWFNLLESIRGVIRK